MELSLKIYIIILLLFSLNLFSYNIMEENSLKVFYKTDFSYNINNNIYLQRELNYFLYLNSNNPKSLLFFPTINSNIFNSLEKTYEFFINKSKAITMVKQLMELKSIALLIESDWSNKLGFASFKNGAKSEIKVDTLIEKFKEIKTNYKDSITNSNLKTLFEDSRGFNILFLVKILDRLNLKMIDEKILHDHDADFVIDLVNSFRNGVTLEDYRVKLQEKKYIEKFLCDVFSRLLCRI